MCVYWCEVREQHYIRFVIQVYREKLWSWGASSRVTRFYFASRALGGKSAQFLLDIGSIDLIWPVT